METSANQTPKEGRSEHSLRTITAKVLQILEERGPEVDLKTLCDELDIQKRRIYDVMNVLDEAGRVRKTGINHIRLVDAEEG